MEIKQFSKVFVLFFLTAYTGNLTYAQSFIHYWGKPETMLQDQASLIFEQSYKILEKYPPSTQASDERKLALYALDALLHDTRMDNSPVYFAYINHIANHLSHQLQKGKPIKEEIRFYRFYNHGFIVQTSSITIGIDLVRGGRKDAPAIDDSLMRAIVSQCDVLFVSHAHSDHADISVAQMFWEQKKYVIIPPGFWDGFSPFIVTLGGEKKIHQPLRLTPSNVSIHVSVYPGHQDSMTNNLYVITLPNGRTIMHTGDQDNPNDWELFSQIGDEVKVDVLIAHCWMRPIEKVVEAVRPSLVICGHENEMEHTIDHREAYWMTFLRMANLSVPFVVMAWGENYRVNTQL